MEGRDGTERDIIFVLQVCCQKFNGNEFVYGIAYCILVIRPFMTKWSEVLICQRNIFVWHL